VRFADTNILLYAISRDPKEQDKAARANDILTARDVALSVQVLQEFYVQATRAAAPTRSAMSSGRAGLRLSPPSRCSEDGRDRPQRRLVERTPYAPTARRSNGAPHALSDVRLPAVAEKTMACRTEPTT
jgi:predicted nucleic acid-binding protein